MRLQVNRMVKEVHGFQEQFPWLQLISMRKIWIINKLLEMENPSAFHILSEVFHITVCSMCMKEMEIVVEVRTQEGMIV